MSDATTYSRGSGTVQGTLLRVGGVGVLLTGPAGSGKSLTALWLMDRGHLLVADDVVTVSPGADGKPSGSAPETEPRIELRGLGIFPAGELFDGRVVPASPIDFVVHLESYDPKRDLGRTSPWVDGFLVCGIEVPRIMVPVRAGIDAALMVELTAARYARTGSVDR